MQFSNKNKVKACREFFFGKTNCILTELWPSVSSNSFFSLDILLFVSMEFGLFCFGFFCPLPCFKVLPFFCSLEVELLGFALAVRLFGSAVWLFFFCFFGALSCSSAFFLPCLSVLGLFRLSFLLAFSSTFDPFRWGFFFFAVSFSSALVFASP